MVTESSPFSNNVRTVSLLDGFRILNIANYKGKTDPQDHLDIFKGQIELHAVPRLARC